MSEPRPPTIKFAGSPGNSQYMMAVDSTRGLVETPTAGSSRLAPGTLRGMWAGRRCHGTVAPAGQALTVTFLRMKDPSLTTNSAWEVDPDGPNNGTKSVAAGDSWGFNYMPTAADWAIEFQAGATAPTSIAGQAVIERQRTSGV